MAEYKAIHGTLFQHKTSDPLAAGVENGAWSSGPAMNILIKLMTIVSLVVAPIFL